MNNSAVMNATENKTSLLKPALRSGDYLLYTPTPVTIKFAVSMILVIVGTFGNIFTLYVIWRSPQLRSRTQILMVWLLVTDLLTGFTGTFFIALYQFIVFALTNDPCQFTKLIGVGLVFSKAAGYVSIGIMVSISIDRYLAIVHPFYYATMITEKWANMSVAISFAYSFCTCIAHAAYLSRVDFSSCKPPYSYVLESIIDNGTYAVGSCIMVAAYGRIFKIAVEQRRKIQDQQVTTGSQEDKKRAKNFKHEFKAVRTTSMILGSFMVLWFPFEVGRFLQAIGITDSYSQSLIDVGMPFGVSNFALSWLIYGLSSNRYRKAVRKVLCSEGEHDPTYSDSNPEHVRL